MMRRVLAACLGLLALAGVAAADEMAMPAGKDGAADKALMNAMRGMNKDMNAPMTGDPDQDFVTMMLPHHTGAVAMAKVELRYGKDPHLRALAKDIVAAQDREIAFMTRWQAKHGR